MSEVRLQVKNLCKNFGITKAVQNVSFNVNKGEVHALIGENGSGKSTLTNMLTGIYSIGSGQFILDGKEIHPKNQVEANNEGVSIIVQELGTLSGLTVAENIFLGHEDQFVHFGIKNTNAMNKKATELLKKFGYTTENLLSGNVKIAKDVKDIKAVAEEIDTDEITLKDMIAEMEKPGRDPREEMPKPILKSDVLDFDDLKEGMELKGTVRNVIDFGVFVDIGVHQDGLVHISEMSDKFIKHPLDVVSVGDVINVKVLSVDKQRKRIQLTMKL